MHNLKNVKNTYRGVLLLVKLQASVTYIKIILNYKTMGECNEIRVPLNGSVLQQFNGKVTCLKPSMPDLHLNAIHT